jgi:sec-independent protein translocase protein TatB
MFDVGGMELLLVFIILLVVAGPDRLPGIIRSIGKWTGYARRTVNQFKQDFEDEFDVAELKRELQESARMEELKKLETELKDFEADLDENFAGMDESVRTASQEQNPTEIGPEAPAKSPSPTELNNAYITQHQQANQSDTNFMTNASDSAEMIETATEIADSVEPAAPKYSGDEIARMAELASGQTSNTDIDAHLNTDSDTAVVDNKRKHEDAPA